MNAADAVTVAKQVLPIVIAAAAASNPKVAAMAPVIEQLIEAATKLQGMGAMSKEQLDVLFADVGRGVQATHDAWVALNPVG